MNSHRSTVSFPYWILALLALLMALALVMVNLAEAQDPLPAIIVDPTSVVTDADKKNDGHCTLREAVIAANDNTTKGKPGECSVPVDDKGNVVKDGNGYIIIRVPTGVHTLTRADSGGEDSSNTGDLDVKVPIKIVPDGAGELVIEGAADASGNVIFTDRLFHVIGPNGKLAIEGATLRRGVAKQNGGAIYVSSGAQLSLLNTTLIGNTAGTSGGAVYNAGTATVNYSTFKGNSAPTGAGAAITNAAQATFNLNNSYFDGNNCSGLFTSAGGSNTNVSFPASSCNAVTDNALPAGSSSHLTALKFDGAGAPTFYGFVATSTSVAINSGVNTGPNALCPATDQIFTSRPQGAACDVGAHERIVANQAPVANDTSVSMDEDTTLVLDLAVGNIAFDPEGSLVFSQNTILTPPAYGDASFSQSNLELTYTPPADFSSNYYGDVTIVYQIEDDAGQTDQGTVTITVDPDNYVEVINADESGFGSFNWAIGEANDPANPDTIIFKISSTPCDAATIDLSSELPHVERPMTINGTLLESDTCDSPHVTINGGKEIGNTFDGLTIAEDGEGSIISGLILTAFGGHGVFVEGAGLSNNGTTIQGNTISSNNGSGVVLGDPADPADGNEILNNTIDDNCGSGVVIYGFEASETLPASQIAGNDVIGNTITNNGFCGLPFPYGTPDGVTVPLGQNNQIIDNNFGGNEDLAIDLADDGMTDNDLYDPDQGPNQQQNNPLLQTAVPSLPMPGAVVNNEGEISGWLFSEPNKNYTVHLYSSTACTPENVTLLNVKAANGDTVTALDLGDTAAKGDPAPGDGAVRIVTESVDPLAIGTFVLATATDENGNTSEFSTCLEVNYANIVWTRAVAVGSGSSIIQTLNHPSEVRWYKIAAPAFSKINVNVTQNAPGGTALALNAVSVDVDVASELDFDAIGFNDIGEAYAETTGDVDLNELDAGNVTDAFDSAQMNGAYLNAPYVNEVNYAGAYLNGAYLNGAYLNEALFSADLYAGAYLNGAYLNGAYLNQADYNGAYLNGAYLNGAYLNGAYLNEAYGAGAYLNGNAYTSAMLSSVITASANSGSEPEDMGMFTYNNPGTYYVRVQAKNGEYNPDIEFNVTFDVESEICNAVDEEEVAGPGAFRLSPVADNFEAIIVVDYDRMNLSPAEQALLETKLNDLSDLIPASDPAINPANRIHAAIVDVGEDDEIVARNTQADTIWQCPYAKNLVGDGIKELIDGYRELNPNLQYIILIGSDNVIPFYRYPDQSGLGPESQYEVPVFNNTTSFASLASDTFLSQDAYGSSLGLPMKNVTMPIPEATVGRLVETVPQITNMIDLYLDEPVLNPESAFVSAYDFLTDGGQEVASDLDVFLSPPIELINDTWTATQFKEIVNNTNNDPLLSPRLFDIGFWSGHFSATEALAADYATRYDSSEFMELPLNYYAGALIYSAGCHSSYNIVNEHAIPGVTADNELEPDWAAAMANMGATFIGGTGYQYGDDEFVEYSERLYANFTRALRYQDTVTIGDALIEAKQQYLLETPAMSGIHQKALLEATIYGLPMKSVNMPGALLDPPEDAGPPILESDLNPIENAPEPLESAAAVSTNSITTTPGQFLGLHYLDVSRDDGANDYNLALNELDLINVEYPGNGPQLITVSWLTGPDGEYVNAGAPVLPLDRLEATVVDDVIDGVDNEWVLRGLVWLGGEYVDVNGVTPLVAAASTESSSVHSNFASFADYPQNLFTVNRYDALINDGGRTVINFTPAQHKTVEPTDPQTSRRREYKNLAYRMLYLPQNFLDGLDPGFNSPDLSAGPDIYDVQATAIGSNQVEFTARVDVDPSAGVEMVMALYTTKEVPTTSAGEYKWVPVSMVQDPVDSTLWTAVETLENGAPENVEYIIQAASGVGLVTVSNNYGLNYIVSGPRKVSQLDAGPIPLPTSGQVGDTVYLSAQLSLAPGEDPTGISLADKPIIFSIGQDYRLGWTDSSGFAEANVPLVNTPPTSPGDPGYEITISFGGDAELAPSTADTPGLFTVLKGNTQIALSPDVEVYYDSLNPDVPLVATLMDDQERPLAEMTVYFKITDETATNADSPLLTVLVITDQQGEARLGEISLPATETTYKVWAKFNGTNTYGASDLAGPVLLKQNHAPDCDGVYVQTKNGMKDHIWPPNGNMIPLELKGGFDPDGDSFTYHFLNVYQDESLTGLVDAEITTGANSCSDASVRSDRDGGGDGRVYHIEYRVMDDKGAFCEGTVSSQTTLRIPVAHDNSDLDFIDGGPQIQSTAGACQP